MSEYEPDGSESSEGETCPWDGCDYTSSPNGVKVHHAKTHGESIAGVPVECDWCGDVKRVKKNVAEQDKRHFCDQECWGAWASENVSGEDHHQYKEKAAVECAACGATIERHESQVEGKDRCFCDYECMGDWRLGRTGPQANGWEGGPAVTDCTNCGALVVVKQSRYKEENRYFCSRACCNDWQTGLPSSERIPSWPAPRNTGEDHWRWKGGEFPYGEGWTDELKETVRERQGRECAGCGTHESDLPRKLDVHHIQKARSFDDDETRNDGSILVGVCLVCHPTWEQMAPLRPQTPHFDD